MSKDIAALIGSRICHDLISPIGAIGNGVELLAMSGAAGGAEMDLITESVQNANARIRFFRIAYGAAMADQHVGRKEILSVLTATAQGGRFTYFWQLDNDQQRDLVRIAFLVLQCFETAMPLGGEIHISHENDAWIITGTGSRIVVDPELWDVIGDATKTHSYKAAQVQFALLPIAIAEAGRTLEVSHSDAEISVRF